MLDRNGPVANSAALDGFWLPSLAGRLETRERAFGPDHMPVRVPVLTPHTFRELLVELKRTGREVLATRSVNEILASIENVAGRVASSKDLLHDELVATLPGLTGYSEQMIAVGLERMSEGWTARALREGLEGEFGALDVLDAFQARQTGGYQRAFGPELTVHIFSGNIPGVSVSSLVRALCVKSPSFGKTAAGEPYLAVCFARALAEHDEELARCLAVSYWPGGSEDLEAIAFSEAGAVITYGSDESIGSIACRVPPGVSFLGYPNRVGAALLARSMLNSEAADELARGIALDVVSFDQQGCVSPHIVYAERGGQVSPLEFAQQIAIHLDGLSRDIPRGTMSPGESTSIHQLRAQAEVRGATVLGSQPGTEWSVIVEERVQFDASPLNRVIQVRAVERLADALAALAVVGRRLQTVAIAASERELETLAVKLGAIGATRIVPIGQAAWPSPHWHHDGRFQFMDLVRFTDLER